MTTTKDTATQRTPTPKTTAPDDPSRIDTRKRYQADRELPWWPVLARDESELSLGRWKRDARGVALIVHNDRMLNHAASTPPDLRDTQ